MSRITGVTPSPPECRCWSRPIRRKLTKPRAWQSPVDPPPTGFVRDIPGRVMIPAYARPAHRRLRAKLDEIARWNEVEGPNPRFEGAGSLGIIASGVAFEHAREAAADAAFLKL